MDNAQIRHEIVNSILTMLVGTGQVALLTLMRDRGWAKIGEGAPLGTIKGAGTAGLLLIIADAWFYMVHRFLHHPKIYKHVHAVHHRSIDVETLSSYSFHVVEAFLVNAWTYFVFAVLPVDMSVLGFVQVVGLLNNLISHGGFEFLPKWWLKVPILGWSNSATFHSQHHTRFNGNYGLMFRLWDQLLGTELSGYEEAFVERGEKSE